MGPGNKNPGNWSKITAGRDPSNAKRNSLAYLLDKVCSNQLGVHHNVTRRLRGVGHGDKISASQERRQTGFDAAVYTHVVTRSEEVAVR